MRSRKVSAPVPTVCRVVADTGGVPPSCGVVFAPSGDEPACMAMAATLGSLENARM
jgi:hypothetical protein